MRKKSTSTGGSVSGKRKKANSCSVTRGARRKRPTTPRRAASREEMLSRLRQCDGQVWMDWSSGYGSLCTLVRLGRDGLADGGSLGCCDATVESVGPLNGSDVKRIKAFIASGDCSENDPEVCVVREGRNPRRKYYFVDQRLWDGELKLFETAQEATDELYSQFEFVEMDTWDEMSDDELRHWCSVLDWMARGYRSVYQLP